MSRYLVVANQTLGGSSLDAEVRERLRSPGSSFYVVTPITKVRHEAATWTRGFALDEHALAPNVSAATWEAISRQHATEHEEADRRARHRLERMLEKIRAAGGVADGEVGVDDDPVEATRVVVDRQAAFDEIIVSTLPAGISRWVRMDVPSRIRRVCEIPVTTIEAEAEGEADRPA